MMPDFDKRLLVVAVVIFIFGFFGGVKYAGFKAEQEHSRLALSEPAPANQNEKPDLNTVKVIKVYMTGAVAKPGVYALSEGDRVYQAVEMAGGLLSDAEAKGVNMAAPLQDGQTTIIPKKGEAPLSNTSQPVEGTQTTKSGKVNINTATVQELDRLNGIGPTIAQRIIEYRQSHGPFQRLEDLKKVSGIGEKKYADLKDSICL